MSTQWGRQLNSGTNGSRQKHLLSVTEGLTPRPDIYCRCVRWRTPFESTICGGRITTWCYIMSGQLTTEWDKSNNIRQNRQRNVRCVTTSKCFRVDSSFKGISFSGGFSPLLLLWCNRYGRWGWRWEGKSEREYGIDGARGEILQKEKEGVKQSSTLVFE